MNAYSGYQKIKMNTAHEAHTTFYADGDILCYKVPPFIFINAWTNYERMTNMLFKSMLGKNIKVYEDDMLDHVLQGRVTLSNLRKAFKWLRLHNVHKNSIKCVFGVKFGIFWDSEWESGWLRPTHKSGRQSNIWGLQHGKRRSNDWMVDRLF